MSKAVICKLSLSLSHTRIKAHVPSRADRPCVPHLATQYVTSVQLFYHCTSGRPICGQPEHFDRSLETATSAVQHDSWPETVLTKTLHKSLKFRLQNLDVGA